MYVVDAHAHIVSSSNDFVLQIKCMGIHIINISIAPSADPYQEYPGQHYCALAMDLPHLYQWCTTINAPDGSPDYAEREIEQLERDFTRGALCCKIWKNVGMSHKHTDRLYLMVDNPVFRPIFNYLQRVEKPLILHVGDPIASWQPLNTKSPHYAYYKTHPEWYMHGKRNAPHLNTLLASAERLIAMYPRLRIIGAHFGSMTHDLKSLARRLDAYKNFAIDTAGVEKDLAVRDPADVREFLTLYSSRIMFGSDIVWQDLRTENINDRKHIEMIVQRYSSKIAYYKNTNPLKVSGISSQGLGLEQTVLDDIFHRTSLTWFGLEAKQSRHLL